MIQVGLIIRNICAYKFSISVKSVNLEMSYSVATATGVSEHTLGCNSCSSSIRVTSGMLQSEGFNTRADDQQLSSATMKSGESNKQESPQLHRTQDGIVERWHCCNIDRFVRPRSRLLFLPPQLFLSSTPLFPSLGPFTDFLLASPLLELSVHFGLLLQ